MANRIRVLQVLGGSRFGDVAAAATFRARFTEPPMKQAYWKVYQDVLREKALV